MTGMDLLFVVVGLVAVGGGFAVVTTNQLVRAGLWLVVTLGAVAVEFLLLGAEFVAWVQVLIYVGAVVVLLLFAVMLTRAPIGPSPDLDRPVGPAALVGGAVGLGLATLFVLAFRGASVAHPGGTSAKAIGESIFADWVLPFEVLSVLLLAALIGAIVASRPSPATSSPGGAPVSSQPAGAPAPRPSPKVSPAEPRVSPAEEEGVVS